MNGITGDFTSFTFNGYSSADLGLTVVASGNRYSDKIVPTFKDNTVSPAGGDGTFYWNTNYDKKEWPINVAFDGITEQQLRQIRRTFDGKALGPLVFYEEPYKTYFAKLKQPIELKYVCFSVPDDEVARETSEIIHNHMLGAESATSTNSVKTKRLYKGEGTINFIAYQPFAECGEKYLENYTEYDNVDEWAAASGLLEGNIIDPLEAETTKTYFLYNPGDMETDWEITLPSVSSTSPFTTTTISFYPTGTTDIPTQTITISSFTPDEKTYNLLLSSKTGLLQGLNDLKEYTGELYNDYVSGEFFKIPMTISTDSKEMPCITITGRSADLNYNYLYY